ncbi:LytTR family DNA-binding domain-containing protein [Rapidithrix thailandica]|uniref:LytTR family DNA-binding domain-containing protein n=1 Tax=Rapidithrix thailandica TaxID=413964 RepID=A0AAW9S6Y9_9BACT
MKILIVEDEPRIRRFIENQVKELLGEQQVQVVALEKLLQAQEYIHSHPIDLLLLDLNLNGQDGFDLLKEMVAGSFHTIVISAYKDRAIEAFEYGVLDFIAKPFTQDRLAKALDRFSGQKSQQDYRAKYLSVKAYGRLQMLPMEEVLYIQGANNYSEVYLENKRKFLHDKSLENLLLILPGNFERVHKSYIVNMNKAAEIQTKPGSRYFLVFQNKEVVPIGRTRFKEIKQKLLSDKGT